MYLWSSWASASKTGFYVTILAWWNFKLETPARVGSWAQLFSVPLGAQVAMRSLTFLGLRVSFVPSLPFSEDGAFQRFWVQAASSLVWLPSCWGTDQHASVFLQPASLDMARGWFVPNGNEEPLKNLPKHTTERSFGGPRTRMWNVI